MSTRFYWHPTPCAHCGRADEPIYIGKTGRQFGLKVYTSGEQPTCLSDWVSVWQQGDGKIIAEGDSGRVIPSLIMLWTVMSGAGFVVLPEDAE